MTDSGDAVITSASGTNSATTEPQPSATDALPIASDCASNGKPKSGGHQPLLNRLRRSAQTRIFIDGTDRGHPGQR